MVEPASVLIVTDSVGRFVDTTTPVTADVVQLDATEGVEGVEGIWAWAAPATVRSARIEAATPRRWTFRRMGFLPVERTTEGWWLLITADDVPSKKRTSRARHASAASFLALTAP
jgi:uncharacterized protein involved in type VI secretion and phage assembly